MSVRTNLHWEEKNRVLRETIPLQAINIFQWNFIGPEDKVQTTTEQRRRPGDNFVYLGSNRTGTWILYISASLLNLL